MPSGFEIFFVLLAVLVFLAKASVRKSQSDEGEGSTKTYVPSEAEIKREIERLKAERRQKASGLEVKSKPVSVKPAKFVAQVKQSVKPLPTKEPQKVIPQPFIPVVQKVVAANYTKSPSILSASLLRKDIRRLIVGKIILDPPVSLKNFRY